MQATTFSEAEKALMIKKNTVKKSSATSLQNYIMILVALMPHFYEFFATTMNIFHKHGLMVLRPS